MNVTAYFVDVTHKRRSESVNCLNINTFINYDKGDKPLDICLDLVFRDYLADFDSKTLAISVF